MLAMLALLLVQAPVQAPELDLSKANVHELVKVLRHFGDHTWELGREKEPPLGVRAENELRERIRKGAVLDLADWQTILLEKGYLQHRERWPKEEPFAIGLHVPPICAGLSIELAPHTLGWSKARAIDLGGGACMGGGDGGDQVLGALFWTDREVVFDLSVTMLVPGGDRDPRAEGAQTEHLGSIRIPVQAVKTLEEAVPRVVDRELDSRIQRLIAAGVCVVLEREPGMPAHAFARLGLESHPAGVLLALKCVAFEHGQARGSAERSLGASQKAAYLLDLPESVVQSKQSAREWTLKFTGSNAKALRTWYATQYWSGEFEVPLADLIRR
ncbi:MAG: hypothetical protein IPJ19_14225 [Planctomycetes bacterium]|nr:hypothetical protein [Planctomycetota bacterium]